VREVQEEDQPFWMKEKQSEVDILETYSDDIGILKF